MKNIILGVLGTVVVVAGGAFIYLNNGGSVDGAKDMVKNAATQAKNKLARAKEQETLVYESEVNGPDECSSYEEYDEEAGVCYFECSDAAECKDIQNEIDKELEGWTDGMEEGNSPYAESIKGGDQSADSEKEPNMLAKYNVSSGEKITFVSGKDSKEYRDLWEEIAALAPNNISDKYIETYGVYSDANSDSLAYVEDGDQNGKWNVVVNLAGHKQSSLREQKATLVHELGHIITLNRSQVVPKNSCSTYSLDEGCALDNSVVYAFEKAFWKGVKAPATYSSSKFITEYATTDIAEDMAETFAFFVMDKGMDKLGNTVKEQKIKMLYNYPELVSFRDSMRSTLGKDIVRAKKMAKTN